MYDLEERNNDEATTNTAAKSYAKGNYCLMLCKIEISYEILYNFHYVIFCLSSAVGFCCHS